MAQATQPASTFLAWDGWYGPVMDLNGSPWCIAAIHGDGANILFMDGHVKWLKIGMTRDKQHAVYNGWPNYVNNYDPNQPYRIFPDGRVK